MRKSLKSTAGEGLVVCLVVFVFALGCLAQIPFETASEFVDYSNQACWWSPLALYEGGNEYAYLAYNYNEDPTNTVNPATGKHSIHIKVRTGRGTSTWSERICKDTLGNPVIFDDDLGHKQPSIARDDLGYYHVFGGMHGTTWRYFCSETIGGDPILHSEKMPDQGALVTYPVVATAPNGDIYLIVRVNHSSESFLAGHLYRLNHLTRLWSRVAIFAAETNYSVYPDDIQVDSAGNVHILFEWAAFVTSGLRHQLSYIKYNPNNDTFYKANGATISVPVTRSTVDKVQDLEGTEAYVSDPLDPGGRGVQGAKMAMNGSIPRIAYRYRPTNGVGDVFNIRFCTYSRTNWINPITVYNGTNQTVPSVDITFSSTGNQDRVYYTLYDNTAWMALGASFSNKTNLNNAAIVKAKYVAAVRDSQGVDILYITDIINRKLYYGRN